MPSILFESDGFSSDSYKVTVHYTKETDIDKVAKFESTRIMSLISRGLQPKSDYRIWDEKREISITA